MNKKDYIDAMNELEVDEKLRREMINKMKENKKERKYNRIYPLASLAIMAVLIIAIVLPNKTIAPGNEIIIGSSELTQEDGLPKVENFENMYAMLKKIAKKNSRNYNGFLVTDDVAIAESATATNGREKAIESAPNSEKSADYSETNIQVQGVDEADIVKTDGRYIYYVANNKLTITDTNNGEKLVVATKLNFRNEEFRPHEIFVKENKLVIIGTENRESKSKRDSREYYYYPSYDVFTVAKIYNIEDKANPKEERTVEIEGNYLSSRMIDNNLYLVSNKYNYNAWLCKEKKIEELNENDFKPQYIDTAISENTKSLGFDCIYYFPETEDSSYLNIAAFDITKNEAADIETYLGAGSDIYASANNLYVIKDKSSYGHITGRYSVKTEIFKFKLENAKCTFLNNGEVPGSTLNQFSMDEKDGYFRIATTDYGWNSEDNANNLYVLNSNLEIVGKIEGLAEGERIYSVRFMGDRAYMVTFVQTDPLFVIDLKDPTNPKVLGELKIPGYSKYLHPYDETHLIGFGEDTKVVNYGYGDVVTTDGMKMALFDVTDPNNPKEMYNVKIGEKGTYSELLYNHKALLFSKEKNIIAFPISITEDDYQVTFQGAIVYGLSLENGFELKGKISNTEDDVDRYYYRNSVERIIYIKDTIYTISNSLIKATNMNTMETQDSLDIK